MNYALILATLLQGLRCLADLELNFRNRPHAPALPPLRFALPLATTTTPTTTTTTTTTTMATTSQHSRAEKHAHGYQGQYARHLGDDVGLVGEQSAPLVAEHHQRQRLQRPQSPDKNDDGLQFIFFFRIFVRCTAARVGCGGVCTHARGSRASAQWD